MIQILVVSLGGSHDPVVNCIASLRPNRVVFLCSEGSRVQVDTVRAAVPIPDFQEGRDVEVLQQRFSRRQGVDVINELDHLDIVYRRAADLLQRLRCESPGSTITVDYTGGTKTMAAGLALAAIDVEGVQLHVTTNSERPKGENTLTGPSIPVSVAKADIQSRRLLHLELPLLLKRFDYEAARMAVNRVRQLQSRADQNTVLLVRLEGVLSALDAWDRFDHRRALEVLDQLGDRSLDQRLLFPLKRVIGSRRIIDSVAETEKWPHMSGHGLEAVEDLIRNAERRAAQDRYDDAVGRLYRAMELTAQLLLKNTAGIDTSDVDIEKLPIRIQEIYLKKKEASIDDGKLKLALMNAYDLLADLENPVGLRWRDQRSSILDSLKIRNHSLFAHGFSPISYSDWKKILGALGSFLQQAIDEAITQSKASALQQLPRTLAELLPSEQC